ACIPPRTTARNQSRGQLPAKDKKDQRSNRDSSACRFSFPLPSYHRSEPARRGGRKSQRGCSRERGATSDAANTIASSYERHGYFVQLTTDLVALSQQCMCCWSLNPFALEYNKLIIVILTQARLLVDHYQQGRRPHLPAGLRGWPAETLDERLPGAGGNVSWVGRHNRQSYRFTLLSFWCRTKHIGCSLQCPCHHPLVNPSDPLFQRPCQ
ncbi:hypothetical protein T310_8756, partial [Rasamsonia emersonii CBS 393.64]